MSDFDTLFEETPGQRALILEGQGAAAILEFAADIELNAYDLYKTHGSKEGKKRTCDDGSA